MCVSTYSVKQNNKTCREQNDSGRWHANLYILNHLKLCTAAKRSSGNFFLSVCGGHCDAEKEIMIKNIIIFQITIDSYLKNSFLTTTRYVNSQISVNGSANMEFHCQVCVTIYWRRTPYLVRVYSIFPRRVISWLQINGDKSFSVLS